jgi:hypothetical protein
VLDPPDVAEGRRVRVVQDRSLAGRAAARDERQMVATGAPDDPLDPLEALGQPPGLAAIGRDDEDLAALAVAVGQEREPAAVRRP